MEKKNDPKATKDAIEPEPGTWAHTARIMAEIEPNYDWDQWKDQMKEADL